MEQVVSSILIMAIPLFIYLKVLTTKIEEDTNTDSIIKTFKKCKENANINDNVTLRVNRYTKKYSGCCLSRKYFLFKSILFLDEPLINHKDKNKSLVLRVIGHELSHIKNKDPKYKTLIHAIIDLLIFPVLFITGLFNVNLYGLTYKILAFSIVKELRCDIEGCHDIAQLNDKQIEEAFDFAIVKKHSKTQKEMTEEELKKIEVEVMKEGYPSYITRKKLTLKYNRLTEETIREVIEIFYTHIAGKDILKNYRINRKEKLIKELTKYYISEKKECKVVGH